MSIKGQMKWAKNVKPKYFWYNGVIKSITAKDKIDPSGVAQVSWPVGDREDPNSRIYPFKVHKGFYMPGRDASRILNYAGWGAVFASLIGVLIHALGRIFSRGNGRKEE